MKNGLPGPVLEDWYRSFAPAGITVHNIGTGEQIQELSLVAVQVKTAERIVRDFYTGQETAVSQTVIEKCLAVGQAARAYENVRNAAVFSPFRNGQIAHYDTAQYLLRTLLRRVSAGVLLFRPVVCVRVEERTTQVEERAIMEAAIQAGARRVIFYHEPLDVMLRTAPGWRALRHALVLHIEPADIRAGRGCAV